MRVESPPSSPEILVDEKTDDRKSETLVWRIFRALDLAEVEYCLLRGRDELFVGTGYLEIDLLVKASHLPLLAQIVSRLGFVELPSWGHAPHYFFVAFDKERGDWIKLDIVTDLRYGKPIRRFRVDLAEKCLRERQRRHLFTLSPENEFITLFLHGLLDKGHFKKAHQLRLAELWRRADGSCKDNVALLVNENLAPVFDWEYIARAIDGQNWRLLHEKSSDLSRLFFLREPLMSTWRNLSARCLRSFRPLFFALCRRGCSVALLAPDGAGKSTLAAALINDRILKGRRIYMGTNVEASTTGLLTTRWLHYKLKSFNGRGGNTNPYYAATKGLNFVNKLFERWLLALTAQYHLLRGRCVIFDRFIYDSWVNKKPKTLWKRIRRLLFEGALPTPDLVVLLDAPGELLFKRKGEHSPEWLEEQRRGYHALLDRLPQMRIVNAANSSEVVRHEVISLIWRHYGTKTRKLKQPHKHSLT